jgi:hypothetical protein
MPHCQICLVELPNHLEDCPVKTGRAVSPEENYTAHAHDLLMERLPQVEQQGALGLPQTFGGFGDLPSALLGLRIERLEKELALLQARVAKLERAPEQTSY